MRLKQGRLTPSSHPILKPCEYKCKRIGALTAELTNTMSDLERNNQAYFSEDEFPGSDDGQASADSDHECTIAGLRGGGYVDDMDDDAGRITSEDQRQAFRRIFQAFEQPRSGAGRPKSWRAGEGVQEGLPGLHLQQPETRGAYLDDALHRQHRQDIEPTREVRGPEAWRTDVHRDDFNRLRREARQHDELDKTSGDKHK